jgi:hypothetical protein
MQGGRDYAAPVLQEGERAFRDMLEDLERFHRVCARLSINPDNMVSLADLTQSRAGTRVACCLWDVVDALQRQGWAAVPLFASTEERNAIRRSLSKGLNTPRLVSVLVGRWLHFSAWFFDFMAPTACKKPDQPKMSCPVLS